jgi:hypothetical protein
MTKRSTLIYQFNSLTSKASMVYDLRELLQEEELFRNKLKDFKNIRIKSPKLEILQTN